MSTANKPITCRAAVAWELNKPLTIETVEVAPPKKGEVRIKMCSAGICHSDKHYMEGFKPNFPFPSVLGHEGSGRVESVGEEVTSVQPGDVVVLCFESNCGDCDFCKNPKTNFCLKSKRDSLQFDGTSRITCKGQQIFQLDSISTFSEYTVTSEFNVAKIDSSANPHEMCLTGCCIPSGYGAVTNVAKVTRGSTCAIWGLGGVGMSVAMGCRDSGASKIIGINRNPRKFELAKEFGCTDCLSPKEVEDVPKTLAEMTGGGVDFCFVAAGSVPAMEQAFMSSHIAWGKTVIIGLSEKGAFVRAGVWELLQGRQLFGTFYGSYKPRQGIPMLVDKVLKGEIQLQKLISHRLPLNRINDGFHMLTTGESLRTIIDFDLKE